MNTEDSTKQKEFADSFVFLADSDTETHRTCGICEELKPNSDFYKDGTYRDGTVKYRRDCKQCYKKSRIMEKKNKTYMSTRK